MLRTTKLGPKWMALKWVFIGGIEYQSGSDRVGRDLGARGSSLADHLDAGPRELPEDGVVLVDTELRRGGAAPPRFDDLTVEIDEVPALRVQLRGNGAPDVPFLSGSVPGNGEDAHQRESGENGLPVHARFVGARRGRGEQATYARTSQTAPPSRQRSGPGLVLNFVLYWSGSTVSDPDQEMSWVEESTWASWRRWSSVR